MVFKLVFPGVQPVACSYKYALIMEALLDIILAKDLSDVYTQGNQLTSVQLRLNGLVRGSNFGSNFASERLRRNLAVRQCESSHSQPNTVLTSLLLLYAVYETPIALNIHSCDSSTVPLIAPVTATAPSC